MPQPPEELGEVELSWFLRRHRQANKAHRSHEGVKSNVYARATLSPVLLKCLECIDIVRNEDVPHCEVRS